MLFPLWYDISIEIDAYIKLRSHWSNNKEFFINLPYFIKSLSDVTIFSFFYISIVKKTIVYFLFENNIQLVIEKLINLSRLINLVSESSYILMLKIKIWNNKNDINYFSELSKIII